MRRGWALGPRRHKGGLNVPRQGENRPNAQDDTKVGLMPPRKEEDGPKSEVNTKVGLMPLDKIGMGLRPKTK